MSQQTYDSIRLPYVIAYINAVKAQRYQDSLAFVASQLAKLDTTQASLNKYVFTTPNITGAMNTMIGLGLATLNDVNAAKSLDLQRHIYDSTQAALANARTMTPGPQGIAGPTGATGATGAAGTSPTYSNVISALGFVPATTQFAQTATKTVSGTSTKSTIFAAGVGSLTVAANAASVGACYRLTVRGLYSTPTLNLGTLTIGIEVGGAAIATSQAVGLPVNLTDQAFEATVYITCRSTGTTGTGVAFGVATYTVGTITPASDMYVNSGNAPFTWNTTVSNTLDLTVKWSNSTAGQSISSLTGTLERLN